MLGAPGEDGVFRYEPPKDDVPLAKPEEDDEEIKGWFDTSTDPRVAEALRAAEAVARKEVPSPLHLRPVTLTGPSLTLGEDGAAGQPPGPGVDLADSPELSDEP
jgi:hypothetical protein